MSNKRNFHYIDIMRAICCFAVFIEHFTASFKMSYLSAFRRLTGYTLFSFLNDGRLAINMFCTISGFLIVWHSLGDKGKLKSDYVKRAPIKRFFYMVIPSVIVCIVSFIVVKLGLLGNKTAYELGADPYIIGIYQEGPSIKNLVKCIYGVFIGNTPFSPQLWTMYLEIWGGSICFLILFVAGNKRITRIILYVLFMIISIAVFKNNYFEAFGTGMIIADFLKSEKGDEFCHIIATLILYIGVIGSLSLSSLFYKTGFVYLVPVFCATFLGFGYCLWKEDKCNMFLEKIRLFGVYSYGFYLIHFTVIATMSAWIFIWMINKVGMVVTFFINFLCTFFLVLLLSGLIKKYILDKISVLLTRVYYK